MKLESIIGDLRAYKQLEPGTFQHADELTAEYRTNDDLRNLHYTADGAIYFMKDDTPMLAITRGSHNPVLNNIDDAFTQLTQERTYRVDSEEAETAINAEDTEVFDLTKLNLEESEFDHTRLVINISGYENLNSEQRRLAKRIFGRDGNFVQNMGIEKIQIWLLNPDYVRKEAVNNPIGRSSWFCFCDNDLYFEAYDRHVDEDYRLRGVRASEASTETLEG